MAIELKQEHNEAAGKVRLLYTGALADEKGAVNPVNLLIALGCLAGQELLKSKVAPDLLAQAPEGHPFLAPEVSEEGPVLLNFLGWVCAKMGITGPPETGAPQPVQTYDWYMKLVLTLETATSSAYEAFKIPAHERPYVVLLAAANVLELARDVIPPAQAQGFIVHAFIYGAKTAPYRDPSQRLGKPTFPH